MNIFVFIKIRGDALCQLPKRLEGPHQDVQMKERIEEGLNNLQPMITINVTSHQSSQLDTPAEGNCALWVILDGYTNVMKDDALFPPDDDV